MEKLAVHLTEVVSTADSLGHFLPPAGLQRSDAYVSTSTFPSAWFTASFPEHQNLRMPPVRGCDGLGLGWLGRYVAFR